VAAAAGLAQEDRRLTVLVHASFTAGRGYYGSPRVHDDLLEWEERVRSGHSLTQRTETAICFWPWG
jgi:hypothetical protein